MMQQRLFLLGLLLCGGCFAADVRAETVFYAVGEQRTVTDAELVASLSRSRVVLVGEHHTDRRHHAVQEQVIRLLHRAELPIAVGLEMFRRQSQPFLDAWTAGKIPEEEFRKIYLKNWNFDWELYRDIFVFARDHRIPMIGLNVPPEITRQVARQGFSSLDEDQRGELSNVTCRVDKEYMEYIRRAFGAHAHGKLNFSYFCEAQLVWDSVMAVGALDYLRDNPDSTVILLAGTGHARKPGIPAQIRKRSSVPVTVILPEISGAIDAESVGIEETDYLARTVP
ncbi:MAG: ChaN family lipoprotein [Desulfobacteraceae bacterium]|jgi:uncharacterized iron-regulated protein|nr:ChaN family lipoprotein [Desulfobacteraceae bacterium]